MSFLAPRKTKFRKQQRGTLKGKALEATRYPLEIMAYKL